MPSPKSTKSPPSLDNIAQTAFDLAAEKGWAALSMTDIAQALDITLAQLHEVAHDKAAILTHFGRMIDRIVLETIAIDPADSPRDRLFEVIMERFDALNAHRAGALAVLEGLKKDPAQALCHASDFFRAMDWMQEAAGLKKYGAQGLLQSLGIAGVYLHATRTWVEDESEDLSKTMAALDKGLSQAEECARMLGPILGSKL